MQTATRRTHTAAILAASLLSWTACHTPTVTPAQRHAAETRWAEDLQRFAAEDAAHPPRPGCTLFVGSSSFRLWHNLSEAFPDRCTLNRGFGGSQMHDLLALADRLVWPYAPREILVYEGDNDIAAGKSPDQFYAEFRAFPREVHRRLPHARVYFVSIKPSPARESFWPMAQQANQKSAPWPIPIRASATLTSPPPCSMPTADPAPNFSGRTGSISTPPVTPCGPKSSVRR
jgi:hypothetical protein